MEDSSERWFILERLRADRTLIEYEEAVMLAFAAFPDVPDKDLTELFEQTTILNDSFLITPAKHYAWCGVIES